MDPLRNPRRRRYCRFPRPRGDGPSNGYGQWSDTGVSPPTRGWTVLRRLRVRVDAGFPAHAGMDHQDLAANRPGARFPRPRGDGPAWIFASRVCTSVSPPTRGWTSCRPARRTRRRGFPAHAGMDPGCGARPIARLWFPRPRGDGPETNPSSISISGVSPPTRGWTCQRGRAVGNPTGFPAHAGMDHRQLFIAVVVHRFPRPRGDGP